MAEEPTTEVPASTAGDGGMARTLPTCPLCGAQLLLLRERCRSCGGVLLPLLQVQEMADGYFNRAVVAARGESWAEAAEHLAVTLALRDDDVDALVLLGKVRFSQGQHDQAVTAWHKALHLAPDRTDAKLAIDQVTSDPDR